MATTKVIKDLLASDSGWSTSSESGLRMPSSNAAYSGPTAAEGMMRNEVGQVSESSASTMQHYNGADWKNFVNKALPTFNVDFLVVAGGGAGIYGGGGAGGLRATSSYGGAESALVFSPGSPIPIVVGAGGTAPATAPPGNATSVQQGGISTFSTITSVGGGAGGFENIFVTAMNGGSGGGGGGAFAGSNFVGGAGFNTGNGDANNQGFNGGIGRVIQGGGAGNSDGPGGGGGAGALGLNGTHNNINEEGGNGGAGKTINITGVSLGYAGGGGGGTFVGTEPGGTASDGGGAGGNSTGGNPTGDEGSPNTGGGGGAGLSGQNGGSGIVILRCTKATATLGSGITVNSTAGPGSVNGVAISGTSDYYYSATLGSGTITFS